MAFRLMIIGYYVFLGKGDYHRPHLFTKEWLCTWNLRDWENFIKKLLLLDVNTLMIYLNGHQLPYSSSTYPSLIDKSHPNNKHPFLVELLNYIKSKKMKIVAVLTTTGHAGGFLNLYPQLKIKVFEDEKIEATLVSFPRHMRKRKLSKTPGAAQLGFGVLCHNKPMSQIYAQNIIKEVIKFYGNYFDGIALHPPESAYPCYCEDCAKLFVAKTGNNLLDASKDQAKEFFISSYLKFQNKILFPQIRTLLPDCDLMMFTIPWLFEKRVEIISLDIPQNIILIEWDYNLESRRLLTLFARLEHYKKLGYQILFMPTAGFSFDPKHSINNQIRAVKNQLKIAEDAGVIGISHFIGPKLSSFLPETSRKNLIS